MANFLPDNITASLTRDFSDYFATVGENITKQFSAARPTTYVERCENKFSFQVITEELVTSAIKNVQLNKATGINDIQARVLKDNPDILSAPLCHLFNHSLNANSYPYVLKMTKVVPVYKTGNHNIPGSYRPISVLSIVNNIFEKLIAQQLKDFLSKNNSLPRTAWFRHREIHINSCAYFISNTQLCPQPSRLLLELLST